MEHLIALRDRFEAILPHAKLLFPEDAELFYRLSLSLRFGHVDGFDGWLETVEEWSSGYARPARTLEALGKRSVSRAVMAYAAALRDPACLGNANSCLDAVEDFLQAGQEVTLPRLNLEHVSPVDELADHVSACRAVPDSAPTSWYRKWVEEGALLAGELDRTKDPIFALGILDAVLCTELPLFMIKAGTGYSEARQRHGEACQLFMRVLEDEGFEIICPLPQVDVIDFSAHELRDDSRTGWGAKVAKVLRIGLSRRGQVIRKAIVEPCDQQTDGSVDEGSQHTTITDEMFKGPGS